MSIFYVYAYLREDGSPYYIGKGKGKRAYSRDHSVSIPPKNKISILLSGLTELEAFDEEKRLIKEYGRKGIENNGILYNILEGGAGSDTSHTLGFQQALPEMRRKAKERSITDAGRKAMSLAGSANKGVPKKEGHKRKISEALRGKTKSSEHSLAISESKRGKPNGKNGIKEKKYSCPHCNQLINGGNLKRWHGDNCRDKK
jgi:hypothetical protein